MTGKIFLVGAGPGRADLLTLRAARVLEQAQVVLHDRLVSEEVLALCPADALLVDVGKREGEAEEGQRRIMELLLHYAARYPRVVRLKGGDPFVFGRGGEEWEWLVSHGLEVEVVPGISSSLAVPALAGIPPTLRGVANGYAVVTGHVMDGLPDYWARYAGVETLIVLMGVKHRVSIAQALLAAGRSAGEPTCFVENGTRADERAIEATLGDVASGKVAVSSPSVWVIGEVVLLRSRLVPLLEELAA